MAPTSLKLLLLLPVLALGCGDNVQGSLRLLLAPVHQGRNPVQDPFELVHRVELGLVEETVRFHPLGEAAPMPRFGPGLVAGGRKGAPYLIGLNQRSRPLSQGFGPFLALSPGIDAILTVPFYKLDTALAARISEAQRAGDDPFLDRPPALFVDHRHKETGFIDDADDLCVLVTLLWQGHDLLLKARVRDDRVTHAPAGGALTEGDALRIYLGDVEVTVAPDGRVDPVDVAAEVRAGEVSGGYLLSLALPLPETGKNRQIGFNLRIYDRDGEDPVALATWKFDADTPGDELRPAEFGRLVLGVPLLDLLPGRRTFAALPGQDGMIAISGSWNREGLALQVLVPDDQVMVDPDGAGLEGADRVELYLDLANGQPPVLEPFRYRAVAVAAGGGTRCSRGNDLAGMQDHPCGVETGASVASGSYTVDFFVPWEEMQLRSDPQRGWFLGAEIRVVDQDHDGVVVSTWSDADHDPDLWSELRLFSLE